MKTEAYASFCVTTPDADHPLLKIDIANIFGSYLGDVPVLLCMAYLATRAVRKFILADIYVRKTLPKVGRTKSPTSLPNEYDSPAQGTYLRIIGYAFPSIENPTCN